MSDVPRVRLNNGVEMPQIGLGVWQIPDMAVAGVVLDAFEKGYRSIDTATGYGNERGVGEAVSTSGLPREEVFVTTKLANWDHRDRASALAAFDNSLALLGLDYVDLYPETFDA